MVDTWQNKLQWRRFKAINQIGFNFKNRITFLFSLFYQIGSSSSLFLCRLHVGWLTDFSDFYTSVMCYTHSCNISTLRSHIFFETLFILSSSSLLLWLYLLSVVVSPVWFVALLLLHYAAIEWFEDYRERCTKQ